MPFIYISQKITQVSKDTLLLIYKLSMTNDKLKDKKKNLHSVVKKNKLQHLSRCLTICKESRQRFCLLSRCFLILTSDYLTGRNE